MESERKIMAIFSRHCRWPTKIRSGYQFDRRSWWILTRDFKEVSKWVNSHLPKCSWRLGCEKLAVTLTVPAHFGHEVNVDAEVSCLLFL